MTGRLRDSLDKEISTRAKLNALAADAQESDRNEAQKALDAASLEVRSALKDEPCGPLVADADTQDAETRERLELRAKTGIGDFLRAAAGGAAVTGAAAEYATSLGVPTVGHLPMAMFARTAPAVETRAITPGPDVKGALQPIVPFVFERSAAASLGIMMPTVPSGQVQIPKITTASTGGHVGEGRRGSGDGGGGHAGNSVSRQNRGPIRGTGRRFGRYAEHGIGAQRVAARQHEQ